MIPQILGHITGLFASPSPRISEQSSAHLGFLMSVFTKNKLFVSLMPYAHIQICLSMEMQCIDSRSRANDMNC